MDFDSSAKFIASLAKFLQSLCNGYVDFDKGVEVIGHIYINVDSDTGKKVDYVLNEKVCKNDNSITFISNSFHAQPAEKPKPPPPKKSVELDKQDEDTVIMNDSGQAIPNSTNVGTIGPYRSPARGDLHDSYNVGSKRPRSPPHRRGMGSKVGSPVVSRMGMPHSPRYQDSGGPVAKMSRNDIPPSPLNMGSMGGSRDDYEASNVFHSGGDEEDSENYSNYLDPNAPDVDQKPVIDPDISIVKEEYLASQNSCSYSGGPQTPSRGKSHQASAYPVMLHQSPSGYGGTPVGPPVHQSDMYPGPSLEGAGDPSTDYQMGPSFSGLAHAGNISFSSFHKRRRSTLGNQTYTEEEKEEMVNYALLYGATAAARHFSRVYAKRIPRESVKNFITLVKKQIHK